MTEEDMSITTYTPASIASWEYSLASRTELCLSVAGMNGGKLTLYAGPNTGGGREPLAVLAAPDAGTYISSPATGDIETWIQGILQAAEELIPTAETEPRSLGEPALRLCA
ncbi:hypothetical protein [Arthrobacter sp. ISL-95]|uniref:hypothetical protein n=1 Tax=Arthrobacter sp. ISL-95 TaxID=2819116 RepID=UPI001BE572A4|nr:hypothetical protein [Arthrobacter sp. ISL-95]MBT2588371.1 hypothetical protein [Arthrobacter sp. ISL-95]